ncbi:hypothetical protein [Ekhidna sp.]
MEAKNYKLKHIVSILFIIVLLATLAIVSRPFQKRGESLKVGKDGIDVKLSNISNNPFSQFTSEVKAFRDSITNEQYEIFINLDLVRGNGLPIDFEKTPLYKKMIKHQLIYINEKNISTKRLHIEGTRKGVVFQSFFYYQTH